MKNDVKEIIDEYFKRYSDTKARIKELTYKLEEFESNLYNVSGISYNSIPKSIQPPKDRLANKIQRKDEIIEQINELESERKEMEQIHIKDIYQLHEEKQRRIMRMFYIDDLRIESISDIMRISINHIYKLKRSAEINFIQVIQNDSN